MRGALWLSASLKAAGAAQDCPCCWPEPPHLVKPHEDVAADACREVDLGLEVELDANHEGGVLELAVVIDGALEEVAC